LAAAVGRRDRRQRCRGMPCNRQARLRQAPVASHKACIRIPVPCPRGSRCLTLGGGIHPRKEVMRLPATVLLVTVLLATLLPVTLLPVMLPPATVLPVTLLPVMLPPVMLLLVTAASRLPRGR